MPFVYSNKHKNLLPLAKANRKTQTEAERKLWHYLRNSGLEHKFKRQQQIGNYIVDFICFEKNLVIECDGSQHVEENIDRERTEFLTKEGFKILRFWNFDILKNIEGVWEEIKKALL